MSALAEKDCVPCKGGVEPLKGNDLRTLGAELNQGWQVVREHHLEREFKFKDFREALNFTDKVGFAEKMNTMPKYVVSSTLKQADWNNTTILSGDA